MATSSLASLVVSLEANIAKFTTDMNSASAVTQKTMTGISDSIGKAKSQFLNLAASVVSVGAVIQSVKGAVQLGDDLKQMADTTGLAVKSLDQLSIVAKLNGSSLEGMATGFKGLNKTIVEAQDSTSKSGKLFTALGVSVKDASGNLRGVDDVMGDVAKALNNIENETTRAAVGTAIFGKSYLAIAATLRNFEADQKAANEVLEKFGSVSNTAANLADELGDRMTLLGEGSKRALLTGLVPGMAAASQAIQEVISQGGAFQTSFGDVISKVVEFVSSSLVSLGGAFRVVGTTIAAVAASIATGSLQPLKDLPGEIAKIEAQVIASQGRIRAAAAVPGLDDSDQISRAAGAQSRLNVAQADGARLVKILGDSTKAAKANIADYADDIQKLNDEIGKLTGSDGGYTRLAAAEAKIAADRRAGKIVTEEKAKSLRDAAKAADEEAMAWERLGESFAAAKQQTADMVKYQNDVAEAVRKANESIEAQNAALRLEHATLGLSDNARQQYITGLKLQEAELDGNTNAVMLLREQLDLLAQRARDDAFLNMAQQARQALEAATGFFSDFFVDLFNNGTSAFKNLWESFKQMAFRALAEIAAKQIVVSIVGAVTGGVAGTAAAAAGGGGVGGIGSLLGGIGSLFGAGGGAFSAAAGAGVGAGIETLKLAANAGLASVGGLGAVAGALSTFVPYAAIAALAVPLIGKLFGGNKPPKEGGFGAFGVDIDRFVKQTQFDDSLNKATAQMAATFDTFNKALGGTLSAGFAQGVSGRQGREKEGTTAAFVGGQEVFRSTGAALGKDEASITAALVVESKRAILAALQASDIAPRFAEILDTVVAATAGAADIDKVLGLAQSLQMVEAALGPLNDRLGDTAIGAAETAQGLIDAAGGAEAFASKVGTYNQLFVTQSERLDAAFTSLSDNFKTIGVEMPDSIKGFRDLVDSLDLTTEAGRTTWSALMDVAPAFASVTNAVQGMIQDIYALQDSIHGVSGGDSALNQLNASIAAFVAAVPGFGPVLAQLGSQGFAANLANIGGADLSRYTPSNIALIQSVLSAYNALLKEGGGPGVGGTMSASDAYAAVFGGKAGASSTAAAQAVSDADIVAEMLEKFAKLAGQTTGDYGEELALQVRLVTAAITDAGRRHLPGVAALLRTTNSEMKASLDLFNNLTKTYTDDIAEQLVKLTESYNQQAKDLKGNAVALDVLNTVFEEQWTAIINGTATGVTGTMDELRRLQQGILGYVDSLKLSADSPLTARQKLEEAQRQYETTLAKAQTGDTGALGDITGSADTLLKIGRDLFASSPAFTELFNKVTGELTALGTADFGAAPLNAAEQALLDALPKGSTLMSALDLQNVVAFVAGAGTPTQPTGTAALATTAGYVTPTAAIAAAGGVSVAAPPPLDRAIVEELVRTVAEAIAEGTAMLARSNAEDTDEVTSELERTRLAIVEAITVGLK